MKINGMESNDVILKEFGQRLKSKRIEMKITQQELARESGVSLRMIVQIENGHNVSLNSLISILRVLRIVENINLLVPEEKISPIEYLELGKKRERVSKKKQNQSSSWKWGDEK